MTHVLIVGSTGYLGRHLVTASVARGWRVSALVRSERHRAAFELMGVRVVLAEATDSSTLEGVMDGVDVVISALGITRQKDGLRYMDVDYQANVNVLEAAQEAGVGRMVYVATFKGAQLKEKSEMVCAKERFVARLRGAEIRSTVIRPTGFFSDMGEFVTMAERGRVWLIGDGTQLLNPIDGEDLAQCVAFY